MYPGRPPQNPGIRGSQMVQYPGMYYKGTSAPSPWPLLQAAPVSSASSADFVQYPSKYSTPTPTPSSAHSATRSALAESYERIRNEMRGLKGETRENKSPSFGGHTAPPPPNLKLKNDPLSSLCDNTSVSLSSLLEAAMAPSSGDGDSMFARNENVLDVCERKLEQIYNHRCVGEGSFFPDSPNGMKFYLNPKSVFRHYCRLEFNVDPDDSWLLQYSHEFPPTSIGQTLVENPLWQWVADRSKFKSFAAQPNKQFRRPADGDNEEENVDTARIQTIGMPCDLPGKESASQSVESEGGSRDSRGRKSSYSDSKKITPDQERDRKRIKMSKDRSRNRPQGERLSSGQTMADRYADQLRKNPSASHRNFRSIRRSPERHRRRSRSRSRGRRRWSVSVSSSSSDTSSNSKNRSPSSNEKGRDKAIEHFANKLKELNSAESKSLTNVRLSSRLEDTKHRRSKPVAPIQFTIKKPEVKKLENTLKPLVETAGGIKFRGNSPKTNKIETTTIETKKKVKSIETVMMSHECVPNSSASPGNVKPLESQVSSVAPMMMMLPPPGVVQPKQLPESAQSMHPPNVVEQMEPPGVGQRFPLLGIGQSMPMFDPNAMAGPNPMELAMAGQCSMEFAMGIMPPGMLHGLPPGSGPPSMIAHQLGMMNDIIRPPGQFTQGGPPMFRSPMQGGPAMMGPQGRPPPSFGPPSMSNLRPGMSGEHLSVNNRPPGMNSGLPGIPGGHPGMNSGPPSMNSGPPFPGPFRQLPPIFGQPRGPPPGAPRTIPPGPPAGPPPPHLQLCKPPDMLHPPPNLHNPLHNFEHPSHIDANPKAKQSTQIKAHIEQCTTVKKKLLECPYSLRKYEEIKFAIMLIQQLQKHSEFGPTITSLECTNYTKNSVFVLKHGLFCRKVDKVPEPILLIMMPQCPNVRRRVIRAVIVKYPEWDLDKLINFFEQTFFNVGIEDIEDVYESLQTGTKLTDLAVKPTSGDPEVKISVRESSKLDTQDMKTALFTPSKDNAELRNGIEEKVTVAPLTEPDVEPLIKTEDIVDNEPKNVKLVQPNLNVDTKSAGDCSIQEAAAEKLLVATGGDVTFLKKEGFGDEKIVTSLEGGVKPLVKSRDIQSESDELISPKKEVEDEAAGRIDKDEIIPTSHSGSFLEKSGITRLTVTQNLKATVNEVAGNKENGETIASTENLTCTGELHENKKIAMSIITGQDWNVIAGNSLKEAIPIVEHSALLSLPAFPAPSESEENSYQEVDMDLSCPLPSLHKDSSLSRSSLVERTKKFVTCSKNMLQGSNEINVSQRDKNMETMLSIEEFQVTPCGYSSVHEDDVATKRVVDIVLDDAVLGTTSTIPTPEEISTTLREGGSLSNVELANSIKTVSKWDDSDGHEEKGNYEEHNMKSVPETSFEEDLDNTMESIESLSRTESKTVAVPANILGSTSASTAQPKNTHNTASVLLDNKDTASIEKSLQAASFSQMNVDVELDPAHESSDKLETFKASINDRSPSLPESETPKATVLADINIAETTYKENRMLQIENFELLRCCLDEFLKIQSNSTVAGALQKLTRFPYSDNDLYVIRDGLLCYRAVPSSTKLKIAYMQTVSEYCQVIAAVGICCKEMPLSKMLLVVKESFKFLYSSELNVFNQKLDKIIRLAGRSTNCFISNYDKIKFLQELLENMQRSNASLRLKYDELLLNRDIKPPFVLINNLVCNFVSVRRAKVCLPPVMDEQIEVAYLLHEQQHSLPLEKLTKLLVSTFHGMNSNVVKSVVEACFICNPPTHAKAPVVDYTFPNLKSISSDDIIRIRRSQFASSVFKSQIEMLERGECRPGSRYSLTNSLLCKTVEINGVSVKRVVLPPASANYILDNFHSEFHSLSKGDFIKFLDKFLLYSRSSIDSIFEKCLQCQKQVGKHQYELDKKLGPGCIQGTLEAMSLLIPHCKRIQDNSPAVQKIINSLKKGKIMPRSLFFSNGLLFRVRRRKPRPLIAMSLIEHDMNVNMELLRLYHSLYHNISIDKALINLIRCFDVKFTKQMANETVALCFSCQKSDIERQLATFYYSLDESKKKEQKRPLPEPSASSPKLSAKDVKVNKGAPINEDSEKSCTKESITQLEAGRTLYENNREKACLGIFKPEFATKDVAVPGSPVKVNDELNTLKEKQDDETAEVNMTEAAAEGVPGKPEIEAQALHADGDCSKTEKADVLTSDSTEKVANWTGSEMEPSVGKSGKRDDVDLGKQDDLTPGDRNVEPFNLNEHGPVNGVEIEQCNQDEVEAGSRGELEQLGRDEMKSSNRTEIELGKQVKVKPDNQVEVKTGNQNEVEPTVESYKTQSAELLKQNIEELNPSKKLKIEDDEILNTISAEIDESAILEGREVDEPSGSLAVVLLEKLCDEAIEKSSNSNSSFCDDTVITDLLQIPKSTENDSQVANEFSQSQQNKRGRPSCDAKTIDLNTKPEVSTLKANKNWKKTAAARPTKKNCAPILKESSIQDVVPASEGACPLGEEESSVQGNVKPAIEGRRSLRRKPAMNYSDEMEEVDEERSESGASRHSDEEVMPVSRRKRKVASTPTKKPKKVKN